MHKREALCALVANKKTWGAVCWGTGLTANEPVILGTKQITVKGHWAGVSSGCRAHQGLLNAKDCGMATLACCSQQATQRMHAAPANNDHHQHT